MSLDTGGDVARSLADEPSLAREELAAIRAALAVAQRELAETKRQLAEAQRREELARQEGAEVRRLLRAASDVVLDPQFFAVAVRDAAGAIADLRVAEANEATRSYRGLPREAIVGSSLMESFPGVLEAGLYQRFVAVIESGAPLMVDDLPFDSPLLDHTARYDVRAARVGDGVSVTWRDVTDRHESARKLAESERHFRELSESTARMRDQMAELLTHGSVLAFRTGLDGQVRFASGSSRNFLGYAPADLVDGRLVPLLHPDDLPAARQATDAVVSGEGPQPVLVRLRRSEGGYRTFEGTVFGTETPGEVQATLTDVSGQQEAQRLRALVVAVASHELRTPLAFIYATLNMLADGTIELGTATGRDLLSRMIANVDRLSRMSQSLLKLQRMDLAAELDNPAPVPVGRCVAEAAHSVPVERGVVVDVVDECAGLQLRVDADLLAQAVINLVHNAVRHSPDGAQVQVRAVSGDLGGHGFLVIVRDNGPGVPQEHREAVFEPFHQVRREDRSAGTGLGLAIAKRVAELHHGWIRIGGPAEGTGAVVTMAMRPPS